MIVKLSDIRRQHRKTLRRQKRIVFRYLMDVSAALPCSLRKKHTVLHELSVLSAAHTFSTREELEGILGTLDELVHIYIGENTTSVLKHTKQRRTAAVFLLLFVMCISLGMYFSRPMVHYTESVEVFENEMDIVTIQNPGTAEPLDTAMPRTGSKTVACFDRKGTKLWTVTLTGSFGYIHGFTGQVLEADDRLITYTTEELRLRRKSYLTTNTAVVEVTMQYSGVTVLKKITLTCDRYGKLT